MNSKIRRTALAVVAGAVAGLALTACGSSAPATSLSKDGTYKIGEDIATGLLVRPGVAGAAACMYKINDSNGDPFGVSQTVKDEALYGDSSWFAPKRVLSRVTLKPLGEGLPLIQGYEPVVRDCGSLVIHADEAAKAAAEAEEKAVLDDAMDATPTPTTSVEAPAGMRTSVTAPGTYTVGNDIAAGVWAPERFTSTADVKALTINGIPARTYVPTDSDSGKLHVAFDATTTTGLAGDGYQRADGTWDMSVILSDGQTVTVTAPLTVPFALYKATS